VTRDTFGFAMKATWGVVDGVEREVFKDPATDDGTKKSIKGLVSHKFDEDAMWSFKDQVTVDDEENSDLPVVFLNGEIKNKVSLDTIRSRIDTFVNHLVSIRLQQGKAA
ncbi:hypothetical protein QYM41_17750, partial [Kocuria sp. CPCC 205268]